MTPETAKQVFKDEFLPRSTNVTGVGLNGTGIVVLLETEGHDGLPDYIDDVEVTYKVVGEIKSL